MKTQVMALCAAALVPTVANAANELRPRTPAEFTDVPCMLTVDKATDPILQIEYSVPYDDLDFTPEELPDSRRHQFFAFAEQRFDFRHPTWINQSDFDRADANGDIAEAYTDDDILELTTLWAPDAWVRITPDDPRLPITLDQAAKGVEWDTTDTPPGTWLISVYTWEPEQNIWSFRFGGVRVVDAMDPRAPGPSAFLSPTNLTMVRAEEPLLIEGCIDAPEGSVMSAWWGVLEGIAEPTWVRFIEDEPVATGELGFDFVPPMAAIGEVKIRIEVRDPDDATYLAYSPIPIPVVEPPSGTGTGNPTTDSDGADDFGSNTFDSGNDAGGDSSQSSFGGGCRTAGPPTLLAVLALLGLGFVRRHRE